MGGFRQFDFSPSQKFAGLNLLRFAGVSSVTEGVMKMCAGVETLMGLIRQSSSSK